jgi:hypothetical protein
MDPLDPDNTKNQVILILKYFEKKRVCGSYSMGKFELKVLEV